MRLTIAYFKIKKRNLVLINNDTHQRETVSERPIRPPLKFPNLQLGVLQSGNIDLTITIYHSHLSQFSTWLCGY